MARLGNSPTGLYIGPEHPDEVAEPVDGAYKDAKGRIKRQAARFRVFAYDKDDNLVRELTVDDPQVRKIEWTVHVANTKAAWHPFAGAKDVERLLRDSTYNPPLRNADVKGARRKGLRIDPGEATIARSQGDSRTPDIVGDGALPRGSDGRRQALTGTFMGREVYLGELWTDSDGRLVVLGGYGKSESIIDDNPLRHYANNDNWHDDVCDGPVTVRVVLADGKDLDVRGTGWVIVAPPRYSPYTKNIVTLYDAMVQTAIDNQTQWHEQELGPRPGYDNAVSFSRDIYPILNRAYLYQWVSQRALRGHGQGRAGDFLKPETVAILADPSQAKKQASIHKSIFARVRKPIDYPLMPNGIRDSTIRLDPASQEAVNHANFGYMPHMSGDQGDLTQQNPETWLSVTELQYRNLEKWSNGDFVGDWSSEAPAGTAPTTPQPRDIVRAGLEDCQGGPFYPGIEITSICMDGGLFDEAFRVSGDYGPGDITKWMAVPWQADFDACELQRWPSVRPDDVVPVGAYEDLLEEFERDAKSGGLTGLLGVRKPWARGVGGDEIARPDLPALSTGQSADDYRALATTRLERLRDWYIQGRLGDGFTPRPSESTSDFRDRIQASVTATILDPTAPTSFEFPSPPAGVSASKYWEADGEPALRKFITANIKLAPTTSGESAADYYSRVHPTVAQSSVCQGMFNSDWRSRYAHSGKNDLVDKWPSSGYVVSRSTPQGETVLVEAERGRYDMLSFREYFYILMNLEDHPDFLPKAAELAEEYLRDYLNHGVVTSSHAKHGSR